MIHPLLSDCQNLYAAAARDLVRAAQFLHSRAIPELRKVDADAKFIETLTGLVSPHAEHVEETAFALLGIMVDLLDKLPDAAGQTTVVVPAAIVTDIKRATAIIKQGIPKD